MPELATQLTCTGCGACADVCPRSALAMTLDQEGFALPQLDAGRCVECGLCTKACPALDPKPAEPRAGFPQPFAAWSGTPEFRRAAASGGVFAEMAAQVVRSGGAVAGVRTEGVTVRHDLATTLEGVRAFQGSKYLQSETGDIYRRVLGRLKQGQRVLFSGTPCQVAGMIQRAEGQRGRENLVTCDVVCRGVPSRHFWQRYVDSAGSAMSLVSFRDKQEGWLNGYAVTLREGRSGRTVRSTYHGGDLFLRAYGGGYLIMRNSCYACPFAALPRVADVTLGDFWGLKRFPEEQAMGVSLIIVNSQSGLDLLRATPNLTMHPAEWSEALPANPRIYEGRSQLPLRSFMARRHLGAALRNCSSATLSKLYTGRVPKWQFWWWPYKFALRRREAAAGRLRDSLQQAIAGTIMTKEAPP